MENGIVKRQQKEPSSPSSRLRATHEAHVRHPSMPDVEPIPDDEPLTSPAQKGDTAQHHGAVDQCNDPRNTSTAKTES